jgi:hypothetical protein
MKLNKLIQDVGVLNNDELNKVVEAVKLRRNQLHFQDAHSLKFNDRVSFQGRNGITEIGTVEKVKIKYVLVRTDRGQRWNVPGSHLTLIKEKANA